MSASTSLATTARPRGPRPLPFLGPRAGMIRFFRDPVPLLLRLRKEYGLVAALSDGDPSFVCAFGAENNRAVLGDSQRFHNFADVPFPCSPDSSVWRITHGLTALNGETHKKHRRIMMPAFQKAAIDGYAADIVSLTDRILSGWPEGGQMDVAEAAIVLTLRVAMHCLFGVNVESDAEELGRLGKNAITLITSLGVMAFPFLVPGSPFSRLADASSRIEAKLRALIDEKRRNPGGRDVLSLLVHAKDEDGSRLSDDDLVGHANVLYIAAHETTAYTLAWTLFLLSQHPRVAADLSDELAAVLRGAAPTAADVARMPLVDAVIKESMRLLPATPFFFLRNAQEPVRLGDIELPRGAMIALSSLVAHREPELFPEPIRFRPERWKGLSPSPYEFMPFGAGPRLCVGAPFATLALRLMLPMMLQRFRFRLGWSARVSYQTRGITLGPKHGLPMRVQRQDGWFPKPDAVRGNVHELVDLS
jgi:cytochrome P450